MARVSETLLAHSIVVATAITALFALVGMIVGWNRRRTTYAVSFAVLGGLSAFGLMSVFKLGDKLAF